MSPDIEAARDFLNFFGVAETVAKIIVQANGRPISVGVSGAWSPILKPHCYRWASFRRRRERPNDRQAHP